MKQSSEPSFARKVHYRDLWIRLALTLVAAHWVVSFGEPESIFQLFLMWDYWRSLMGSWLMAFTIVTIIRWLCLKLDERLDWGEHLVARGIVQLLLGVGAMCLLAYLLAVAYFAAHGINIRETDYLRLDWPMIILMLIIINFFYLIYYVGSLWQPERSAQNQDGSYRQVLIIQMAEKNIPVQVKDIAYFYRLHQENFLRMHDGTDYLVNDALDHFERLLDPNEFFRANRQFYTSFTACQGFETITNDRLELFVRPPFKEKIFISQKRAPAFRKWLDR